jgi:serine/threonine-protein kinase
MCLLKGGTRVAEGDGEEQTTADLPGMPDVFISYASQNTGIANAVVAVLERGGLRCWIAPRDVTPGALYADEIIRSINGAKVMVVVLSGSAVASPHVGKEVERASSKRRPIIALRTDAAPLTTALEYFLSESQWIELSAEGTEAAFAKLVVAIRRHLAPDSVEDPGHRRETARSAADLSAHLPSLGARARSRLSFPLVAISTLLAVTVAYLVVEHLSLGKRITATNRDAGTSAVTIPTTDTIRDAAQPFAPPAHSIAVLPFVNMSGDANQEYFSDGISEELLDSLSRLNDLQVAARTSSFSFKGKDVDISTVAHKLNVGAVLEGSVRRSGNTIRITVQLINAVTGFHIWSQSYDRKLTDILKLQTEVATSVAQQLEVKLVGDEGTKIELGGTKNADAYDSYLRGLQQYEEAHATERDYRDALTAFDRAISLDPNYALAYTRRAAALDYIYRYPDDPNVRPAVLAQAHEAVERALALAPQLGEAHMVLAYTYSRGAPDLAAAAREYERAVALAPGSAWVQRGFGFFAAKLGHFELALAAARRAVSLDPQKALTRQVLAEVLIDARRYGEALTVLADAMVLSPGSHALESLIQGALVASGEIEKARMTCESPSTPLDDDDRYSCLALVYHKLGRQADAQRELEKFQAVTREDGEFGVAEIYAQWGDKPTALQWLARAERLHNFDLLSLRVDWALDPIRNEPQFKAIESRLHFPP